MTFRNGLAAALMAACAIVASAASVDVSFRALDCNPMAWDPDPASRRICANGIQDMAVLSGERSARMSLSATLSPEAAGTNGWAIMGLALSDDERNYWHLALVQAPPDGTGRPGRRFFELAEMREGVWLSQFNDHLPGMHGSPSTGWEYGKSYVAKLTVDPSGICGEVLDAAGKTMYTARYSFPAPDAGGKVKAVTCGRPALHVKGSFRGAFAALDAE